MAVSNLSLTDTYDALLTTTLRNYSKTLEDNAFQDIPLYHWLRKKGRQRRINGGYEIMVPILYGHNKTVTHYSGYEPLNVTPQEGITTARYKWHQIAISIAISGEEESKNSGEHQLIDLLEAKTKQAEKSLAFDINENLHGAFGSKGLTYSDDSNTLDSLGGANTSTAGFNSLDHFVRPHWGYMSTTSDTAQTHTVGGIGVTVDTGGAGSDYHDFEADTGIDAQTNTWWLNYSNPGFGKFKPATEELGSALSSGELDWAGDVATTSTYALISAMRAMYNRCSEGTDRPDLGLTSFEVFELYESALVPQERYVNTDSGDAGFTNLKFKGMTIMPDNGIRTALPTEPASGTAPVPLYFLNSDYLEWVVNSKRDFITTQFYRPYNQDARTAQILAMCQLCCSNRQRQGIIACASDTDYS